MRFVRAQLYFERCEIKQELLVQVIQLTQGRRDCTKVMETSTAQVALLGNYNSEIRIYSKDVFSSDFCGWESLMKLPRESKQHEYEATTSN